MKWLIKIPGILTRWLPCALLILAVASCSTPAEHSDLERTMERYRPRDRKPSLPALTATSPVSDFITYAVLNNPRAEAAFYDWKSTVEEIAVAGSWPDPQLTLSAEIDRVVMKTLIGFMQEIPGPGKLALRAETVSAQAQKKRYLFEEELLKTAFEIKQVYYQVFLLKEKIRLTKELVALADAQAGSARAGFQTGLNRVDDVTMVRSEQDRLYNELANLEDSAKPLMARWRGVLGIPPGNENPPLPEAALPANTLPQDSDLLKEALENNVQLKALAAEIRQAQALVELAYKGNVPDFGVGLALDAQKTPMTQMPELNMTFPIWRKRIGAEIAAARARKRQAQAELKAEEINLSVLLAEKTFTWRQLQRESLLISEQLIPRAKLNADSLNAEYKTGQTTMTNWLNARRELVELLIRLAEANAERETVFAEITLMAASRSPAEIARIFAPE
ncbi:MAG: TolC family protein [Candidatus Brocadiia bacterium]